MALNDKGGFDLGERLKRTGGNNPIPLSTDTDTPTPTYTPAHATNKKAKERKTERLQLLVRPSTKARLAQYAEDHNTSSNEVVQQLLDELLNKFGY